MLAACFWPFEFHPHNDVTYVPGEEGLRFYGNGTAYSHDSFPSLSLLSESNELTIEITVRPSCIFNSGAPCILSFSPEQGSPALVIRALNTSLIIRHGLLGNPGGKKYQDIRISDVFTPGHTVHLAVSIGPQGTTIFVDGKSRRFVPGTYSDSSDSTLGRLLLGNSPTGDSLWKGEILALALYNRALAEPSETFAGVAVREYLDRMASDGKLIARYRFDKIHNNRILSISAPTYDIIIPTYFAPLRRTVLAPPQGSALLTLSSLKDIVLNVLGFMPFGFLLILILDAANASSPRWRSTTVVIAGFFLSMFIELTQAFLPTRSSSLMDLFANTVGSALGVTLFYIVVEWRREVSDDEGACR